jgi:plastocyanin
LRFAVVTVIVCFGAAILCVGSAHEPEPRHLAPPDAGRIELSGRIEILDKTHNRSPAANTVVWIPGVAQRDTPALPAAAATTPEMSSKDKRFAPHVLAVTAGTEVAFPNVDPIFHNVFSLSPENRFDLGLYRKGAAKTVRLIAPGLVRVYCNIHPDMAAFVMVLDRAAFTVTGTDGTYRLSAPPAGSYTVHVWHERSGEQEQPIVIAPSSAQPAPAPARADFLLDGSPDKPQTHKNKNGRDYPPVSKDVDRY